VDDIARAATGGTPRPAAVVLNTYATGLAIARNLSAHGIEVYGLVAGPDDPGSFSRHCHTLRAPDSQHEPAPLVSFLVDLAARLTGRPILFPTRDADIRFLERNRAVLDPLYVIPQPAGDRLDVIMNKHRLAEAAVAAGIPSPRTIRVRSEDEMRMAAPHFHYPVVAKAVYAQDWRRAGIAEAVARRKAVKIESLDDLIAFYGRIEPYHPDLLIQEWIEGADDQCMVFGAYRGHDDRILGWLVARKKLQYPPDFGLGCIVRLERNPEVERLGRRLLEALSFEGTAEVEFKRHAPSGEYRLIEVNPRHWDQHGLGMACGVNLAWVAYRDLCLGDPMEPVAPDGAGGTWINGSGLRGSLIEDLRHGRIRPWKVAGLFQPGTRYAIWDAADPGPFLRRRVRSA
jgi:D-aspartate ligase